jgi:putative nucleotidyltransferase with HDIG domain
MGQISLKMNYHLRPFILKEKQKFISTSQENKTIAKVIEAVFAGLELRDYMTAYHSLIMAEMAFSLALECDTGNAVLYYYGGLLHDCGKFAMPDMILKGEQKLRPEERKQIQLHVEDGVCLLEKLQMPQTIIDITKFHHERHDGSGYLLGLNGDDIPLTGKIGCIADVYSALTTRRPYQDAITQYEAIKIMRRDRLQFDPYILNIFFKIARSI